MLEALVLIITIFFQVFLGLLVISRNPTKLINKLFLLLSLSLALWSGATYWSLHPSLIDQLLIIRIVIGTATMLSLLLFLTFRAFPSGHMGNKKWTKVAIGYGLFVILLTQTPLVFNSLNDQGVPQVGSAIPFFTLAVFLFIGGAVVSLVKKYFKSAKNIKNQIRPVLVGLAITFGAIVFTNFILVSFFNITSLLFLGPSLTIIFLTTMAYAIARHHLFDIRAVVARTVAYLLTLIFIGVLYGAFAFGISSSFLESDGLDYSQRAFYVSFALVTALLFQSVKKFFDKYTNKIFYRDAYEPQEFLDTLSDILVTTIDINKLLHNSADIMAQTLKASFIKFVIRYNSIQTSKVIGKEQYAISREELNEVVNVLKAMEGKALVVDDISESKYGAVKKLLSESNVSIVIRLSTHNQFIGLLLVGNKQNGTIYSRQDIKLFEIVADELAIATQNALRFEEIEKFNVTLQEEVRGATKQLRHTNEKLKALDETKDEFISMASHQLRTPLTSVKGYLSMVLEGDAGKLNEQQQKLLNQAFTSSQRMVYLISDLLNVSRLKTGKFVIEPTLTDLPETIEEELSQLYETAGAKGLKLSFDKPEDFPKLYIDKTKIRQVIMNFIDNAIYYTPPGGEIKVSLEATPRAIEFKVTDTGLGVPKAEQHHMFTKFYRAENAKRARPDGTGLGLFMAKKVIVAQGGAVVFKSAEGKGSTFGFTFPKSALEEPKKPQ